MFQIKARGFEKDFQFDEAKREARKQDRRRRDARKGKRNAWQEAA